MDYALNPLIPRENPATAERLLQRFFRLRNPGNLVWRTYFWTAAAGGCFCATSFVLLALIVRLLGEQGPYWGGVFSIALAVSQQLITLGLFQMRPFQVSDVDEAFTFSNYFISRIFTVALMFAAGLAWMAAGAMGRDKVVTLLLLLILRAGESVSDVIEGRYQQSGRLDIASKGLFFKTFLPLALFTVVLWGGRNMLVALAAMALLHWLLLLAMDGTLIRSFARFSLSGSLKQQRKLLYACLPLATNAFLFIYVNNLSRYAVDRFLDERTMAEYNALFMPSFIVILLSGFVLRPALTLLSEQRRSGAYRGFRRQVAVQLAWVAVFTVPMLALAYAWGAPLLSLLYGLDLTPHRGTLCILIGAGALLALYYIFQSVLIILRRQTACLAGILLAAVAAWPATVYAVRRYGINGGALSYLFSSALLAVVFMIMTVWYTRKGFSERSSHDAN